MTFCLTRCVRGVWKFLRTLASTAALIHLFSISALAQQRPPIPPAAEPGVAERQLQRLPEPAKPQPGAASQPGLPETAAPAGAKDIHFTLKALAITGNTQIPSAELQSYAAPLMNHDISLEQLYDATRKMTARYRSQGFILANVIIPAQEISDGSVRIEVAEGFLSKVNFEGGRIRPGILQSGRERLLAAKPLRASDLERFLLLLNDLPGVQAQGILMPSASVAGAAELTVKLTQEHGSASLGASYRGSELQGPGQLQGILTLDSLFGLNDSTSLQYLQAFKAHELRLYALSHTERLTADGLDLSLAGSHSEGAPDLRGSESILNLENDNTQGSVELSYPLLRTRFSNLRVRAQLTYHDGKTDVVGFPVYQDKISAARFGISGDIVDAWRGVNVIDIEYGKGLSIFGASKLGDPLASRPGGNPQFSKATLYIARLQSLGQGFSFLLAADGQYAMSNLLSPEEFAFGGDQFGRAYDPSDLVGDSGIAGKAELRYTKEFGGGVGLTLYGFGETARIYRRLTAAEVGTPAHDSATDVGAGLRMTFLSYLTGYIEVAKPTNHVITATGDKETRVFGGLIYAFHF
jgi:hemolysin activation/secretion protein